MSLHVLLVEDEETIADAVAYALRSEGLEVESVPSGEIALERAAASEFDLLVLDLMLPGLSGLEVCRRLRSASNPVPILMLTARTAEVDRVVGLELDLSRHTANVDGREVQLTNSEFRLLRTLAERPGQIYSRRELMQRLWDSTYVGDERAADVHVANLRRKIEADPQNPARILTVRGAGYVLADV